MMKRRDFLNFIVGSTLVNSLSSNVFAISNIKTNNQKLLFVFLRGAYDGLNLLIPHNESFYFENRPTIGIKKSDNISQSSIQITNDFSLNPIVQDTLFPLFKNHELSFIHASGSPDNSRSHFHAQDIIEYGNFNNSSIYSNGFLYRLYQSLNNKNVYPISYTNNLPLILKGDVIIPNISLKGNLKFNLNDKQINLYDRLYKNHSLSEMEKEGIKIHKEVSEKYNSEMMEASKNANSPKGFSEETFRIAKLIKEQNGITIGFIDFGGWDTHVNQGSYSGNLANNLKQLSEGLLSFKNNLGVEWKNTTVVVMSEFGRTIKENGNRGTDHGHGNVMWILGGNINGGKILGNWDGLTPKTIHENRDLPVLNDYRSILAEIFTTRFGISESQNNIIFPNYQKQIFKI